MRIAKIAICLMMLGFLSSCVVYPYDPVVYEPAPLTAPSAQVYTPAPPPPPPPRVYVAPAPVYVAPAPVYVAPPPVFFGGVYIHGGHGGGGHHGGGHH